MPAPRDAASAAAQVAGIVAAVRRRIAWRHVLQSVSWAAVVLLAAIVMSRMVAATAALMAGAVMGIVIGSALMVFRRDQRTPRAAATTIERRYRSLRNLAITATELIAEPDRVPVYMRTRVLQDAARAMAGTDVAAVAPLASHVAALIVVLSLVPFGVRYARERPLVETRVSPVTAGDTAAELIIELSPPAYSGLPRTRLSNPDAVQALAGSVATVRVSGPAPASVRVNGAEAALDRGVARATLLESGSIVVDAGDLHRLLPLTITLDAMPEVHVTAPARDLRITDTKAVIPLRAQASDDLALRAMEIRFTIVSGGGEQFSFSEGRLPASVVKESPRAWRADAALSLATLELEPGDALVYRAVASDARPGAPESSSDTYFVEIAGPGDVALEGVEMPPDKERYALSEAMIVVKLQRLVAAQAGMRRADVEETAANIAAEQRAVRANFVFLLGGEVEDEVVEAEASHEIQEGRLANQARREIVAATVLMGKVEQALAAVSPRDALPRAEEAVRTLQRAFGHSRYLLRALPARIRIDPSRRLSGELSPVHDWRRDLQPPSDDPVADAARSAMATLLTVSRNPATAPRLTLLAEQVLAIVPGAADLQVSSRHLLEARDAFARGDDMRGRAALQQAAPALLQRAQRGRVNAVDADPDALRLAGAAAAARGRR